MESVKAASCLPELVQKDKKGLWIFGESESKRRVIMIEKKNGSYGFTLQSYGVRYKHGNRETDFITYVNAVEKDGAAFHAGLREGDVILSINGQNMARVEHKSLVNFIRKCPTHLKMVVVSDERARKVELHMRYVHLQKKLHDKMKELEQLSWKEKEILAGTYRNPCGSPLGAPCLSAATSACCFCPQKTKQAHILLDEKEKSKTISTSTAETKDKEAFFYDCYRKSQSNRELNHKDSTKRYNGSSSAATKGTAGMCPQKGTNPQPNTEKPTTSTAGYTTTQPSSSSGKSSIVCDSQLKPKSWDNLMTTKSFGGYGFGFGYGYFPTKQHSHGGYNVTHPHHHNHHSHCNHSHSNYYYNKNASHQRQDPGSYGEHRHCPTMTGSQYQGSSGKSIRAGNCESSTGNSKTLPAIRTCGNSRHTPESFAKMEKTLSDTSLNSEHHKDFPKTMSYFNRSSENVRYSSDDEYDQYRTEEIPSSQHDIFV
ncbi:unnamed protein product [Allacma fusca]|uniref:PDZ domain-containing protein n=1 Tax=Allacma fusca TaxID=39272 RepID=A0A8J2LME2_9HEXA|nr:unnamed protein product [Allacma fusca]